MTDPETPVSSAVPEESPKKKVKRSKWLRLIVYGLLFFFAFLGTVIYLAYTRLLENKNFKQQIELKISGMIGLPVSVGSMSFAFPAFSLQDIAVGEIASAPMPWARLHSINITPDFLELLRGTIQFESVSLSSGTLSVARDASGALILPEPLKQQRETPPAPIGTTEPAGFPLGSLDLADIRFLIDDQALGRRFHVTLRQASIAKAMLSSSLPVSLTLSAADLADLTVSGKVRWPDQADGSLELTNVNLPLLKEILPQIPEIPAGLSSPTLKLTATWNRSGKLEISGLTLRAHPDLDVSGHAQFQSLNPPQGKVTFTVAPVPVKTVLALGRARLTPLGKL